MAADKDNLAKLSKAIAPAFNKAAPDAIRWSTESAFFERAIRECKSKGHYVLLEGIMNGVDETIESCRAAARQIAGMGLSCNPSAKLVYFIPRRMKEGDDRTPWVLDATPSYMGLVYIATHYGNASTFGACEVYAADKFINRGPFKIPDHQPTRINEMRTEKQAEGVYAAVRFKNGEERAEYVDAPTVQRIRGLSKQPNSLMYTTVWTEGWKKIAIRRLSKLVMQTEPRMMAAEESMRQAEGFTFDEQGKVVDDVPRETSDPEHVTPRARGMTGLATKMAAAAPVYANHEPPPAAEPTKPALLALPAPSTHPEGSIEWWMDQISGATAADAMDTIKAAALTAKVDQGPDADTFRQKYVAKMRELRGQP